VGFSSPPRIFVEKGSDGAWTLRTDDSPELGLDAGELSTGHGPALRSDNGSARQRWLIEGAPR